MSTLRSLIARLFGRSTTVQDRAEPASARAPASPGIYRQPHPEPADVPFLDRIDAAVARAAPGGWGVRRTDAHTWKVEDLRGSSATEPRAYTVIAFASPRGLLVLHGRHAPEHDDDDAPDEGTFMPEVAEDFRLLAAFKTFEAFLAAIFRDRPPPPRRLRPRPRRELPLDAAIELHLEQAPIAERFTIHPDPPDDWRLVPRDSRPRALTEDYVVTRTREPDGVLVFCDNRDGGPLCIRPQHAVHVPPEQLGRDWLAWVVRHRSPNVYGLS